MTYRCIALDMDGTLLDSGGELTEATVKALHDADAQGKTIILASGRAVRQIRPYAEKLAIRTPIAANNGAQTWLDPDSMLSEHPLAAEWVSRLKKLAEEHGVRFWGHGKESSHYSNKGEPFPSVESVRWLQFAVESPNVGSMSEIRSTVHNWRDEVEVSRANPIQCEINAKGVSKATGVSEICGRLGIPMEQVIAVGDGVNDVKLLQAAGLGVAMGNAEDEVKRVADIVAPTNDEDGVAYIILRFLLETRS